MKAIKVKVMDTNKVIYEGEVDRVSSYNEVGAFDVYPMHANFISIINKQMTFYSQRKKVYDLPFSRAVMKVKQDSISIFLGIEELVVEEEKLSTEVLKI
jgi:F0F1-type ATP synthase epsilon subunit